MRITSRSAEVWSFFGGVHSFIHQCLGTAFLLFRFSVSVRWSCSTKPSRVYLFLRLAPATLLIEDDEGATPLGLLARAPLLQKAWGPRKDVIFYFFDHEYV